MDSKTEKSPKRAAWERVTKAQKETETDRKKAKGTETETRQRQRVRKPDREGEIERD